MAVTEEELLQRHDELQRRVEAEKPASDEAAERHELSQSEHTARCWECGSTWTYPLVVLAGGRTVPERRDVGTCPTCVAKANDAEAAAQRREEAQRAERQHEMREQRLLEMLRKVGANPWEHGHCSFERFDTSACGAEPLDAARDFVANTKAAGPYDRVRGLYLWGTTGAGKTDLVTCAASSFLLDPGWMVGDVVWDNALDLVTRIQDTYNTRESTLDLIEKRIDARVWILDDLGSEQASADVVRRLTLIFTRRALRPTLVTSNYSPEEFESRSEELFRIGSRLGPAYFRAVEVRGADRRHD